MYVLVNNKYLLATLVEILVVGKMILPGLFTMSQKWENACDRPLCKDA
jgi:hypothetical protein